MMTDEQIIKALECCKTNIQTDCENCPLYKEEVTENSTCITILSENALDLINRQQAEIERLNKEVDRLSQCVLYHDGQIVDAKAEAYKEFVEMLKERVMFFPLSALPDGRIVNESQIDNLVKEMVGD